MQITTAVTKNHRKTHPTPPVIPKQSILNNIILDNRSKELALYLEL
jgi:hypothetical protein